MKKRFIGALLLGAFVTASTSMFVSCKDYDDDINNLQLQNNNLSAELTSLKTSFTSQLETAKSSLETAVAAKADASEVVQMAARVAALETQIAAINDALATNNLSQMATTLSALTGKLNDETTAREAAIANIQLQINALNALEARIAALEGNQGDGTPVMNYSAEIKALQEQLAAVESNIKGLTAVVGSVEELASLKTEMQAASKAVTTFSDDLNVLTVLINKQLTSLVLKPNFYWEGIEGVEVPFISQTPVFKEGKNYTFKYKLTDAPAGNDIVTVTVEEYMGWLTKSNSLIRREDAKYVVAPAAAHHETLPLTASEKNSVKRVDIAYGGVANYHVNPIFADLEGATIGFYDHSAPTYTRGDASPSINPKAKEGTFSKEGKYNKFANGILTVPFEVEYVKVLDYFLNWTKSQTNDWEGLAGADKESWADDWDGNGSADGVDDKDNDTWAYNNKLPYIALQVTIPANEEKEIPEAYSVTSDYAVVVPARYTIVALADNAPETGLDLGTFTKPVAGQSHEIRMNHLYETVGYDDTSTISEDANATDKKFNNKVAYGAIPMPATHSVPYNGEIDLADFVETHYDYTTYAQYGKSTFDQTMSKALMEELGLSYKFSVIDYWIGAATTSQSAHVQQSDGKLPGSKFTPRSVTEDGKTIENQPATREAIDREPLIRVDLVDANNNIIRYGYIKLRIVATQETVNDLEVSINLNNDFYMNCGEEGRITWSQVENLILARLGSSGFTKQEFEKTYKLDVYGDYQFMPYLDPSKIAGDTDNPGTLYTKTWQAKRYWKNSSGKYEPAIDGSKLECDDDSVTHWTKDNNHFGEIWYTPHDNSTQGHDWDEQTNVLIWNLYPSDGTAMPAYRTTYNAAAMAKKQAGGMDKAKYHQLRKVAGIDYNNHKSTEDISTVVRFINKNTGASIWVTLVIPKTKIEFEWGEIANKDWSHWWKMNTQKAGVESTTIPYWEEFDTHMNTPVPAYVAYRWLNVNDFSQDLRDYWHDPAEMIQMRGTSGKYSEFSTIVPTTEFIFVTPMQLKEQGKLIMQNSSNVFANSGKWDVKGASGTKWTLKISTDGKKIQAVSKNGSAYGPEDICEIRNAADGYSSVLYFHGLETTGDVYPAATDLLNKSGRYDETGKARYTGGNALGEQETADYLAENVDETFTAYIKVNVTHFCYDPLITKQYFNVRVLRPINVAGKEKKIKDIPNIMQKICIRDLVDIVDYRDIPVVGRYAEYQYAADNAFGIASPRWIDVSNGTFSTTGKVLEQNDGIPYEYYGIKDLAVIYSKILSDHQAPATFRDQPALRTAAEISKALAAKNIKAVKDIPSLRGGLQGLDYNLPTTPRVLSLWSNDVDHSLQVADAWPTTQLVDMTNNNSYSKGIGKIEYTNNSGITQKFHIYVPIAVKYNWGNIQKDVDLGAPSKLDKNYTQTVWGVITVDPSYLGE